MKFFDHKSKLFVVSMLTAIMLFGGNASQAGAVVSSGGEVFLKGNFVEVGIHRAGSFGTAGYAPAGFHPRLYGTTTGRLGFVADPGKDGWAAGSPPQTGDYFVPGSPEEGWMVEWTSAGVERQFHNFGLMGGVDIPTSSLVETSSGGTRSAVWEGTAAGQLKVTQTVSFDANDLFFTMNVVLTNVGTTTLRSLEYMRNVDPDQEQPLGAGYTTRNWVEYQPPRTSVSGRSDLSARPSGNVKKALAVAEGLRYGLTLGLGAIDSRATVAASQGFANRDTDWILNNPNQPTATSPAVADAAIVLAFDLGDLAPGQSTSLSYAYILNSADLEKALGNLAAVTILQPSGTVSGSSVLFQATTDDLPNTTSIDFYVNGALVGSDASSDAGGVFETAFDSYAYPNGTVALKAVAHFADGTSIEKISSASVDNSGPPISFSTPGSGQVFSPGTLIPVLLSIDADHPPVRVSFFRETAGTGSLFLGEDTSADFESLFDVAGLPEGETVVIKAVATDAMGRVTTAAVSGVTVTNSAPVAVASPSQSVECAGSETTVVLDGSGSYDPDGDALTFTWSGPFGTVSGKSLSLSLGQGVYPITLEVTDSKGAGATDSLTVSIVDTAPPAVDAGPDVILEASGPDGSAFTLTETITDSCCLASYSIDPLLTVYPVGATVVTVTGLDCVGNEGMDTVSVTVIDTTAPVLSGFGEQILEAVSADGATATFAVKASDLVDPAPVVVCSSVSGDTFAIGVSTVGCTATDSYGNEAVGSFTVTVQDTTSPEITAPADLSVEATGLLTPVAIGSATATDAVSEVEIFSDAPATFPVGTTVVTWTAIDDAGNSATATQTVTVVDTTAPNLSGLDDQIIEAVSLIGDGEITAVSYAGATATFVVSASDLVDPSPVVVCTPASGDTFALGVSTVGCTATDSHGNEASGSFTITVQDTIAPEITAPADLSVEATGPLTSVAIGIATATDAVGVVEISSDAPATFPVGTTVVTWKALDAAGNTSEATQTVTVTDTTPPALSCPGNIEVLLNTPVNDPAVLGFFTSASATDLVDGDVTVTYEMPANLSVPGSMAVTFESVDAHGNIASCTATISVRYALDGFLPPVILQKPMKLGRTVPVKFRLADYAGQYQAGATATFTVQKFSNEEAVGDPIEVVSTSGADTGNVFRYDDSDELYIYNLDTGILQKGRYQVRVALNDGSVLTTWLSLK